MNTVYICIITKSVISNLLIFNIFLQSYAAAKCISNVFTSV